MLRPLMLASLSPYLSLLSMVEPIDKHHPEESGLVHETNLVQGLAIPTDYKVHKSSFNAIL